MHWVLRVHSDREKRKFDLVLLQVQWGEIGY